MLGGKSKMKVSIKKSKIVDDEISLTIWDDDYITITRMLKGTVTLSPEQLKKLMQFCNDWV